MVTNLHNSWCGCSRSRPVISDQVIGRRQLYIENEQQPATVGRKQRIIVNGRTAHFLPPLGVTRPTPPRPRHFLTSWPVTEDTPSGGRQWQPDARLKMGAISLCTSFIEVPNHNRPMILYKCTESGLHFVF